MTVSKSDVLRKRLVSAGLSAEACTRYIEILRGFLCARMTKSRFEDEMAKVLPKDKIYVHNGIIRELLLRAQQKREGVPDLPVVTPLRDKRPVPPRRDRPQTHSAKGGNGGVRGDAGAGKEKGGSKRKREDSESETVGNGVADGHGPHGPTRTKPKVQPKKGGESDKTGIRNGVISGKARQSEKPSPKVVKRNRGADGRIVDGAGNLPPPSPSMSTGRMPPPRGSNSGSGSGSHEIATYDALPYFPAQPGQAMDVELFFKLRQRMKRIAVEQMQMSGVKDDAVGLMLHGLELHVKSLLEAGCRQRAGRQAERPQGNLQCGPVRGHDFRSAALRNTGLLGDEVGMDLERLLMLL